ncbi:MAG: hypothetical protein RRY78_01675 [Clostridia bacterium]
MEEKILTPYMVWQDFNPVKEALEVSIIGSESTPDYKKIEYFFTSKNADDGKLRVFTQVFYKQGSTKKMPCVLFVQDYDGAIDMQMVKGFTDEGYAVVTFDYLGKKENKENCTVYPPSLEYGNIAKAGEHLTKATPNAKATCVYLWSKVGRRVISFIETMSFIDCDKIACIGNNNGADIMWQITAMDGRVKVGVPINNIGWKYAIQNENVLSDEAQRWVIGCANQSYVNLVRVPIFYAGGTNSNISNFDKLEETLHLLDRNQTEVKYCLSAGLGNQIEQSSFNTIIKFLNHIFFNKTDFAEKPTISYKVGEELEINVVIDDATVVSKVVLNISYNEQNPLQRNWEKEMLNCNFLGESTYRTQISSFMKTFYAFCNIYYKDGTMLSTSVITGELPKVLNSEVGSRILYEVKYGVSDFFAETNEFFIEDELVHIGSGVMELRGICTKKGALATHTINGMQFVPEDINLLQFDTFSNTATTFYVELLQDTEKYFCKLTLKQAEWCKFALSLQDFKDVNMIPMKNWKNIKKLSFRYAENVLFNNILWV